MRCRIVGAPVEDGAGRMGCEMGPSALRTAGLVAALRELGHEVIDMGAARPAPPRALRHANAALKSLPEIVAWTEALGEAAYQASADAISIFLGGDHSISAGTVTGVARRAADSGRPLFVLWLDAHPDFHTLDT
ncbi:MAG: arginase family protein, partial [Nitratireductor sp.]